MDWNWFFSSIAQSAAAIVGIFGAFIITKVLSNQVLFGEKTVRFRSLQSDASRLVDSANNLAFPWYIRLNKERQLENAVDLLKENDDLTPDELYAKLDFPIFLPRGDAIQVLQGLKDQRARLKEALRQRRIEEAQQRAERQERLRLAGMGGLTTGFEGSAHAYMEAPDMSHLRALSHPHAQLSKERDAMDALEVEIRHHMRTITDFLQTTSSNPESSPAIAWALVMVAALFLVGVVYPLSFLPTPSTWTPAVEFSGFWARLFSLRGLLLTAISVIFLAALTMFAVMNRRLRYAPEKVQALQAFTHVATYSPYYAVAEENERIAREMTPSE
jgi:hypothetical protein